MIKQRISQITFKRDQLQKGNLSVSELVNQCLERIQQVKEINAFTEINSQALVDAEKLDEKVKQGEPLGKLAGTTVSLKDMICFRGMKVTAGSKMLKNFVAPYTATLVDRLIQEDAIIIGKCNQDEFAMGSSNEHSFFGNVKNPWNYNHVPGGSSGGSAASVAVGAGDISIGTDTGGSIRQPAHFCGVVGLKPTYGRISRYGVIAFASSLDQAGPITNSVVDAALCLEVMAGADARDATTANRSVEQWAQNINCDLTGKKIGIPKQLNEFPLNDETNETFEKCIAILKRAGAECVNVDLPHLKYAVPVYYLVAASEASSNLARYDGVRYGYRSNFNTRKPDDLEEFYSRTRGEGFGSEVRRRIIMGTYFLSAGYYEAYFQKASQVRRLLYNDTQKVYEKCDAILSPVTSGPAFKIGEKIENPLEMYMNDILTVMSNLVGQPGISVPVAVSKSGLPIGMQILSNQFEEQKLFDFASAIEMGAGFSPLGSKK